MSASDKLADILRAIQGSVFEVKTSIAVNRMGTMTEVEDGAGRVLIDGMDDDTPCSLMVNANVGDRVTVEIVGNAAKVTGNYTAPPTDDTVAEEAKEVAEATNQHFWTDDAGVHVSQETKEDFAENGGPNILVNSSGVLLRKARNWLAQLTSGAVAFYDGNGNSASNLMGSFGPSGVRQYVAGVLRSLLDVEGLTIYDALGHVVGKFGDSARIGPSDSYVYIDGYRFYFRDIDSDPSFLINSKSYSYSESKYIDPEAEVWPQADPSFDFPFFVDSYTVTLDGGVDDTANWTPEDSNVGGTTITNYSAGTWETYAGRTLTFNGSISEGAFVRNIITALGGYYLRDSSNTRYPAVTDNGNNLWIGSRSSSSTHHKGKTYISAGHDGTAGNSTIYVSVPNAANNAANNYGVYHAGNKPALTDLSGILATTHGGTGNANGTVAKLTTPRTLYTALGSVYDSSSPVQFDGSAAKALPVSGTLAVGHGGTGATTAAAARANLGAAARSWTSLGSTTGTSAITFDLSSYYEVCVVARYGTSYLGSIVLPKGALHATTEREIYLGGWGNNSTTSNRRAVAEMTQAKLTPIAVTTDATDRTASAAWTVYAR